MRYIAVNFEGHMYVKSKIDLDVFIMHETLTQCIIVLLSNNVFIMQIYFYWKYYECN